MPAIILTIIAAITGGALPVAVKIGVTGMEPMEFSFWRFSAATASLIPVLLCSWSIFKSELGRIRALLLAGFANTANIVFFAYGIGHTSPVLGQVLYLFSPVLIAIAEFFFFRQTLTVTQIGGAIIATLGAWFSVRSRLALGASGEAYGIAMVVIAMLAYSAYPLLSRRLRSRCSPMTQTITMSALTAAATGLLALVSSNGTVPAREISNEVLAAILFAGILGGALYYHLIQLIISRHSAFAASTVLYIQPLATAAWSWVISGENPLPVLIPGGLLCLIGAALANSAVTARQPPKPV